MIYIRIKTSVLEDLDRLNLMMDMNHRGICFLQWKYVGKCFNIIHKNSIIKDLEVGHIIQANMISRKELIRRKSNQWDCPYGYHIVEKG